MRAVKDCLTGDAGCKMVADAVVVDKCFFHIAFLPSFSLLL